MSTHMWRSAVRRALAPVVVMFLLAGRGWSADADQNAVDKPLPSGDLVKKALESEVAGNDAYRKELLDEAVRQTPGNAAAHWQSGDVRLQDAWRLTDDAKKLAKQDQKWAEYVRRRDAAGQSPEALADLARWCHKNHMDDQARAHWQAVLKLRSNNQEAIRNLGLRPYNGILLTPAEIQQAKSQLRAVEKAMEALAVAGDPVAGGHRAPRDGRIDRGLGQGAEGFRYGGDARAG